MIALGASGWHQQRGFWGQFPITRCQDRNDSEEVPGKQQEWLSDEIMGGQHVLRRVVDGDSDPLEAIAGGFPIAAVETVIREGTFSAG